MTVPLPGVVSLLELPPRIYDQQAFKHLLEQFLYQQVTARTLRIIEAEVFSFLRVYADQQMIAPPLRVRADEPEPGRLLLSFFWDARLAATEKQFVEKALQRLGIGPECIWWDWCVEDGGDGGDDQQDT